MQNSISIHHRRPRRGLTLIELLVVMVILVLLVSSAIPVLSPASDERRIREASRGINAFLAGAQARAVQTGRPVGVRLKKLSQETNLEDDNGVCVEMFYVEQPRPYVGFDASSRVIVSQPNPALRQVRLRFIRQTPGGVLPPGWGSDLLPPGVLRPGDEIEVNGVMFRLLANNNNLPITVRGNVPVVNGFFTPLNQGRGGQPMEITAEFVDVEQAMFVPVYDRFGVRLADLPPGQLATEAADGNFGRLPLWTDPLPYAVLRQPTPTSAPPYQLPEGTAIDLRASGVDGVAFHRNDPGDADITSNEAPVTLMFAPDGGVSLLIASLDQPTDNNANEPDTTVANTVTANIHLLVGLRENIPGTPFDFTTAGLSRDDVAEAVSEVNWLLSETRWVTIGAQTGSVTTVENLAADPLAIAQSPTFDSSSLADRRDEQIRRARELATQKTSLGGK